MPKQVQIGSDIFNIPIEGENPPYGEDLTAFFEAIATALATVQGPNDIPTTTAILANNTTVSANVPGLIFSTSSTVAIDVSYLVTRIYDSGSSTVAEEGVIKGEYNGSVFVITRDFGGVDAGMSFTITPSGQIQYTSSNLPNHISTTIIFRAKTIDS